MLKSFVRLAACAASGAAFLALTGCGGAAPDQGYAGPPPSSYDSGASAPALMGQTGPTRSAVTDGLAGGPGAASTGPRSQTAASGAPRFQLITRRKADGTLQISMRPIANPEDMTPAERRQVYGNRYAPRAVAAKPRRVWRSAPEGYGSAPAVRAKPRPVVARIAPVPAPVVKPAPRPVAVAPVKPAAPAPAVAPVPAVAAAPRPDPVQQLQTAVSPTINRGATLSVPADLKAGKEADVILSLPGDLLAMVQEQAAKLGLGKAARKVNAYANLQGQGYDISPPGQQTAPVAVGKPTTFTWKVKPTQAEKAPLRADYGLELNGAKPKTAFSVGSLEEAVAAPVEAAKSAAKGFKLPAFKFPSLKALAFPWVPEPTLPVVGKVARENLVGGALALLALILLVVMARGASAGRARNERRRKFRTMQDYGVNEPDHDAHHTSYVNPMIAAATGAAGGYALASHGHDDHGHGHDDHGAAHGDSHGHDDPAAGHGDHGHGHDDHGQGHDDHGAHHTAALASHDHDDHGAGGHEDHGHGDGQGHEEPGHGDGHGHDDHGHGPAQHVAHTPVSSHDDHGHGHDDHAAGHDDHSHDGHGHDDHAHGHGHDEHHKEPEHAH